MRRKVYNIVVESPSHGAVVLSAHKGLGATERRLASIVHGKRRELQDPFRREGEALRIYAQDAKTGEKWSHARFALCGVGYQRKPK